MVNDDVNHQEIFNITNVRDLKVGFINIYAITKGYNSALKDHFELIITNFPKSVFTQIENETFRAAHKKSSWILLIVIMILIGLISFYVYRSESVKREKKLRGYSVASVDPYR